jgi:hypothetical protein
MVNTGFCSSVTDMTPGLDHSIRIVNAGSFPIKVLEVRERVRRPDMLGVRFDQICRNPKTSKVRGLVTCIKSSGWLLPAEIPIV